MPYFYKKNTGEGVLKGSIKVIRQWYKCQHKKVAGS